MARDIYVLDACALIVFFNDEYGAEKVSQLFEKADMGQIDLIISVVNLCEVFYDRLKAKDAEAALDLLEDMKWVPISICREIGDDLVAEASRFKVEWKVSLADAFALGLARLMEGRLVSTDHHEFDVIDENGLIQFHWLR
jgi:PIN domain nuclease of toxin-antitoxin system